MALDAHLIPFADGQWACRTGDDGTGLTWHDNRLDALMEAVHYARPRGGAIVEHIAAAPAFRDVEPACPLTAREKHLVEVFAGIAVGSAVSLASARLRRSRARRNRPPSVATERRAA